jgi:hypothetical protein
MVKGLLRDVVISFGLMAVFLGASSIFGSAGTSTRGGKAARVAKHASVYSGRSSGASKSPRSAPPQKPASDWNETERLVRDRFPMFDQGEHNTFVKLIQKSNSLSMLQNNSSEAIEKKIHEGTF